MAIDPFMRMNPLEVAAGWVPGIVHSPPEVLEAGPPTEPLATLESILLDALRRPPCIVEFSGGRDSSAVLAVAVRVAREASVDLPIPMTRIFPDAVQAGEEDWPELVIRHLGLDDWLRLVIHDELDLLGPTATEGLRRHGLLWPVTAHTKSIAFEYAKGGTLISGEGGDEVFGPRRITPLTKLLAGARPRGLGIKYALAAVSPRAIRRRLLEDSVRKSVASWLRPSARIAHLESVVADGLAEPMAWGASVRMLTRRRGWLMGQHNLNVLAAEHDVQYLHPLLEEAFVGSWVRKPSVLGYPTRTHAMRAIFGSLLPAEVLARTTKASFNRPYFHHYCRTFAEQWSGEGVDTNLVDVDELRRVWGQESPHAQSLPLLHQAWIACEAEHTETNERNRPDRGLSQL